MRSLFIVLALLSLHKTVATQGVDCSDLSSCSQEAFSADSCCVPSPNGLFLFRQRFEPDVDSEAGSWGIDGIDVLSCSPSEIETSPSSPAYSHEEIGSFCLRSGLFNGEEGFNRAEEEWAHSEIGEGVEERWERAWSASGRFISTLGSSCSVKNDEAVSLFFHSLHSLHLNFAPAQRLADADITPSSDVTYSLAELETALSFDDFQPKISCNNQTLVSVKWPFVVRGAFQSGRWQAVGHAESSSCPQEGIIYPSTTRPQPTSSTFDTIYRPTPRPVTLKNDPDRMYGYPDGSGKAKLPEKMKLGFFKQKDEHRGKGREDETEVAKQWHRDEL